jgi:hypothetical protein
MIDDQRFQWGLGGFQFQAKLLAQGLQKCRSVRPVGLITGFQAFERGKSGCRQIQRDISRAPQKGVCNRN